MVKVAVIFYSLYGHNWKVAEEIAAGAKEVEGADVTVYQVAELLPPDVVGKMGATTFKQQFAHIPVLERDLATKVLSEADAVIIGGPTRFGVTTAQLKLFLDGLGGLWMSGATVGKVASSFTSSGSQHGGNEMTHLSHIIPLLHLGYIYVGLPYSCKDQTSMAGIEGGSPYGTTTIAGGDGSRAVSDAEKRMARFQGKHVTQVAKDLVKGRAAK